MSEQSASLEITIPAEAGSVAIVRHAVAGLAESIGMEPELVGDLKTVVTEACTNAVVHAYPEDLGEISVEAIPQSDALVVIVADSGAGIRPRAEVDADDPSPSLRLGLSLIASLTTSFSISGGLDDGTKVTMRIPLSKSGPGLRTNGRSGEGDRARGQVGIVAADPALLPVVLSRAISAFGTQRDLSIDRISDAMLLADAISSAAPRSFLDGAVSVAISDGDGGIDLSIGPLDSNGAAKLREGLRLPNGEGTVETVADEVRVESVEAGSYVVFRISGPA